MGVECLSSRFVLLLLMKRLVLHVLDNDSLKCLSCMSLRNHEAIRFVVRMHDPY